MGWDNPTEAVTAWRDQLLACASVVAAGFTSGSFHFPDAVLVSVNAVDADARPLAVLAETGNSRPRYAEGARGLPHGMLSATFHCDMTTGQLEQFARDLVSDLSLQDDGLPNLSCQVAMSSNPRPGAIAAEQGTDISPPQSNFRSLTITATYGLNPP